MEFLSPLFREKRGERFIYPVGIVLVRNSPLPRGMGESIEHFSHFSDIFSVQFLWEFGLNFNKYKK